MNGQTEMDHETRLQKKELWTDAIWNMAVFSDFILAIFSDLLDNVSTYATWVGQMWVLRPTNYCVCDYVKTG